MTLELTIHPQPTANLSPHQIKKGNMAPQIESDGTFLASFGDLLDIVNPLQHIPVISSIYRAITGDTIGTGAQLAGGALFGGPMGFIGAIANAIIEGETGHDIGGNLFAAATGKYEKTSQLS